MENETTQNSVPFRNYPSAAQLQKLFDSLPDVICSVDSNGNFRNVSAAALSVWGYEPAELIGKPYMSLVIPIDRPKTQSAFEKVMRGTKTLNFLNCYLCKDGSKIHMTWSAHWDEKEGLMFCIGRDATERITQETLQEKYEQKLMRKNEEMQEMLDRVTEGFFALDQHFRVVYWNHQAEHILKKKAAEVLGKPLWECFPEAEDGSFGHHYQEALQTQEAKRFEAYFEPLQAWYKVSAFPSPEGLSVFFLDITEQKRKEEELLKLSYIARSTSNLVIITAPGFNIVWVNDAFTKSTGYTLEEIIGKRPDEILDGPETNKATSRYIIANQKKRKSYQLEITCYKKNGEKFILAVSGEPVLDAAGKVVQYFSIATDITERKKAENELRTLSLVAQQTVNIVILADKEGKITWVNAAFLYTTGYSFDEVVGRKPGDLLQGPESDADVIRFMGEQLRNGKPFQVEILNYTKTRQPYWLEIFCQPMFNKKGSIEGFFAIQTDITGRKRMEQILDDEKRHRHQIVTNATIAAQEAERALVGRELHDNINQVLTTVKLYTELCRDGIGNTTEMMNKSVMLLQETINEIRSLSKRLSAPSLGNIKLKDSVKELVASITATNKIRIALDTLDIEEIEVSQDTHLVLYRILQEHLTNILKHADASQVNIFFLVDEAELTLKVTDNGRGFDPKKRNSGIGINNMTARAESLQGKLIINSAPGLGCVLLVQIPI